MSDSPAPDSKPPVPLRRRWRWARWVALSVFAPLALYFAWVIANREWTRRDGERELAEVHAAVEQSDPDWTWEKLNAKRKRPPEGKNGADLIPRIKKSSHAGWGKTLYSSEWKPRMEDVPPNVRYGPAVVALVRADLAASADAVTLARSLKDYPLGHREIRLKPDVISTPLEDTQHTRHAADLLRWDAVIAVEDGDRTRAVEDLHAMLNASRSIGDEPFMISQLVRTAVRSITVRSAERLIAHSPAAPGLAELQAAFARDAEEPLLLYGVRGDRAAFDRLFENFESGVAKPGDGFDRGLGGRIGWWHYRANLLADRASALNWMSLFVEAAKLPIYEQQAAVAAIAVPPEDPKRVLSRLLLPAADKVAHVYWRTTAEELCAVAGIACERFRQRHNRWPNDLAELVPAFLSAVPLDPYGGQPLRYAKSEEGAAVYSVGKKPAPGLTIVSPVPAAAPAPSGLPDGAEFGFRLWNPDRRRQPALPDPDPAPEGEPRP